MRRPAAFLMDNLDPSLRVFSFSERLGKCVRLGSSGAFADSLAVFAAPKRIGLRSHIRLSGVLVKSSSITSSTHLKNHRPTPTYGVRHLILISSDSNM